MITKDIFLLSIIFCCAIMVACLVYALFENKIFEDKDRWMP